LKSLGGEIEPENCCFVLALGENKKAHLLNISQAISKFANHVILTSFEAEQDFRRDSLSPGYLKSYFEDVSTEKVFDPDMAIEKALARPEKMIIFTGSLYMIGPVRAKLKDIKD
jgi:folylpolyglutamate synthase/dihydropteroate synthase